MYRQSVTFRLAVLVTLVASGCAENQIPNNDTRVLLSFLTRTSAAGVLHSTRLIRRRPALRDTISRRDSSPQLMCPLRTGASMPAQFRPKAGAIDSPRCPDRGRINHF